MNHELAKPWMSPPSPRQKEHHDTPSRRDRRRRQLPSSYFGMMALLALLLLLLLPEASWAFMPFSHQNYSTKKLPVAAKNRRVYATSDDNSSSSSPSSPRRSGVRQPGGRRDGGGTMTTTSRKQKYPARQKGNYRNNNNNSNNNSLTRQKSLNQALVRSETAQELLSLLQNTPGALTKTASGGVLNTVNFSTAIHRLARHSLPHQARTAILGDPRLALLLAGLAEAMVTRRFSSREVSNITWALAKLRIVPPSSAMPLRTTADTKDRLTALAKELRVSIVQAAKAPSKQPVWIPLLSQLAGLVMDEIASEAPDRHDLTQQEMSNLIWSWATADRVDHVIFGSVVRRMMHDGTRSMDRNPQEWSNAVWAFATARVYEGFEEMFDFLADLMESNADFGARFKPQEISNTLWGAATLIANLDGKIPPDTAQAVLRMVRLFVPHILSKIQYFKTQELSNTIWSLATLGFGVVPTPELAANGYIVLPTESLELDQEMRDECVQVIAAASHKILHSFTSQELNNLAWGMARLVVEDDVASYYPVFKSIGEELCSPRRRVNSQDIGTTMWSFAVLGYFNENLYREMVSLFTPEMVDASKPQELSNVLWACATSELDIGIEKDAFDTVLLNRRDRPRAREPLTCFMGEAAEQLIRRPNDFKPQELKDFLWSFSKLSIRHPELYKRTAEYLVGREEDSFAHARGLDDFSPQALGNMAWSFARQGQLAVEVAERHGSTSKMSFLSGKLAVKTASCADLGEGLMEKLFFEIVEADLRNHNNLRDLKPQDISNTAWTLGVLSICHEEFLQSCAQQVEERMKLYLAGKKNSMTMFKGQETTNFLWAMATLNTPCDGLLDILGDYLNCMSRDESGKLPTKGIASVFIRQELANIAWSCAVFNQFPKVLMTYLYSGLVGNGKNPTSLAKLYGDGGIQDQAIMTLLYVETAMKLSGSNSNLSLPPGFPDGWGLKSALSKGDASSPTFETLTLTSSKIQMDVSDAFGRIGFDHVEEHVITMEELATEYGIDFAPRPVEVLSIDIADVENRIAIEVDGPSHFFSLINGKDIPKGFPKEIQGKVEYQFRWTGEHQRIGGSTALKERLLESLGWRVIHLPFWEWAALNDETEKEEYCRKKLDSVK